MENIKPIIAIYILSLILIMGLAFGVYLVSTLTASSVFGVAWIAHSVLMVWQVFDYLLGAK